MPKTRLKREDFSIPNNLHLSNKKISKSIHNNRTNNQISKEIF